MSNVDWMADLAAALDGLVPRLRTGPAPTGTTSRRASPPAASGPTNARRRVRVAIGLAVLFLLVTGVATATYLLTGGNGEIAVESDYGTLLAASPDDPGLRVIARCTAGVQSCAVFQPAWSPDGKRVAFVRGRYELMNGKNDLALYVAAADGGDATRFGACGTCGQQYGASLAWSPDGTRIAFSRDDGATGEQALWIVASTGGTPQRVGDTLVFFRTPGRSGHFTAEVWTIKADGSDPKRLYGSDCCVDSWAPPIWSPDGRVIAFAVDSAGGTFVINADGTGLRWLNPTTPTRLSWQRVETAMKLEVGPRRLPALVTPVWPWM